MRRVALLTLLAFPLLALAQVYTWKDASGKLHYSDKPPEDAASTSRRLNPAPPATEPTPDAQRAVADKRQDTAKQAADAKEKAAKAEREREEDAIRQQNCDAARRNLDGIQSGQIRFRMGNNGEREALDGSVREAELNRAQQAVDTNCKPRPAAKK